MSKIDVVNLNEKFALFSEQYSPKIVGELNGQYVKLVRFMGEFPWHKHDNEDEMFFVVKGKIRLDFEDRSEDVCENEFIIVPKGVLHRPVADDEALVMLFEPATTLNTGDIQHELTQPKLEKL